MHTKWAGWILGWPSQWYGSRVNMPPANVPTRPVRHRCPLNKILKAANNDQCCPHALNQPWKPYPRLVGKVGYICQSNRLDNKRGGGGGGGGYATAHRRFFNALLVGPVSSTRWQACLYRPQLKVACTLKVPYVSTEPIYLPSVFTGVVGQTQPSVGLEGTIGYVSAAD